MSDYATLDQLVTGEAVALELPPASVGLRLVSGTIDVVLAILVLVVAFTIGGIVASDSALAGVASVLALVLVWVIIPAVLETLTLGRSVGKLALGLRTVRDDAGPITFHHAFVRHLVGVIEIWALTGVPALISAMVSAKGKRLGDYLAGTYVVRDRVPLQLTAPPQMPPQLAGWAQHADLAPLPDSLGVAVRLLLARTSTLSPQARERLVGDVVAQVTPLVRPTPPPGTHPEDFLAAVAAERRRRDQHRLWREADRRWRLTQRSAR